MSRSDLYRVARAFLDCFIAYKKPPSSIILDIDDTQDRVYGTQRPYSMGMWGATPTSLCIFTKGNRAS